MEFDELVDAVAAKTKGTASDPLSRDEVEQVVRVTVAELTASGQLLSSVEPIHPPETAYPGD
jgi:hypothetical protein